MKNLVFLLIFFCCVECWNNVKKCNSNKYNNFITDEEQKSQLLECIQEFNKNHFRGTILVKENSLSYGWHENEINNPNSILKKLQKYSIYGVVHINGITYFKKEPGFIDNSCGLIYVPEGFELPNGIMKYQMLTDNKQDGKWYFVEAKL